jgi:flagellar biosynthetic protein FliR
VTVTTAEIMTWLGAFFWPFMRIGAMMLAAPVLGDQQVSVRIRLLFAVALTIGVMPAAGWSPSASAAGKARQSGWKPYENCSQRTKSGIDAG